MTAPRLSAIIVNYNGGALVRECLEALREQFEQGWEVFLVDNDSADRSADGLEARFQGLKLIRNNFNAGYARANNQALRLARGEYILLLNPDVRLGRNALATALAYLDANAEVSILGPKILRPDGHLDPPARRSFKTPQTYLYKAIGLSRLFPRHRRFGRYYLSYLDEDQVTEVDSVVGAFLLIRRSAVDRIGHLDERFFMYCEDEDWCFRTKRAGGRVVYHPGVVVHHVKGASTQHRRLQMTYHWHRSLWLFHRTNVAPGYPAPINWLVYAGIGAGLIFATTAGGAGWLARTIRSRLTRGACGPPAASTVSGSPDKGRAFVRDPVLTDAVQFRTGRERPPRG